VGEAAPRRGRSNVVVVAMDAILDVADDDDDDGA
jgi:hypothetical protein